MFREGTIRSEVIVVGSSHILGKGFANCLNGKFKRKERSDSIILSFVLPGLPGKVHLETTP
jgi:hypothetical protein